MSLSAAQRDFLRGIYRNFSLTPLEPGSRFYEPVYSELELEDPTDKLFTEMDFGIVESTQLLSGFSGSGKSTQLLRLQEKLELEGYFVLYANALDYLNSAEPIEIGDLIVAMAGAFGEQLAKSDVPGWRTRESFFERANRLLNADVILEELTVKSAVDVKFELKSPTTFRLAVQQALARRLKEFKAEADVFFGEGVRAIQASRGPHTRVVFILDDLEKMRGTVQTGPAVIAAIRDIFSLHRELLQIPSVHCVFSTPAWLKFALRGFKHMILLATIHLWNNDETRTRYEPAWTVFQSLIRRRLDDEAQERLFGNPQQARLMCDRLIEMCGGQFRDLMRLLQDVALRAATSGKLPITPALVEEVISEARRDFTPLPQDEAVWLDEIARVRATALPDSDAETINRLTGFLDSHSVLYFKNKDDWYDVHPLLRDEIRQVLAAVAAAKSTA